MSKELGTLVIVVLKGQHLIDNHTFYKQDPYVKLSLSGATKQTPVDPKGGQHPVWDAELRFPISKDPSKSNRTLTISVFSEEKKEDELLGEGTVEIADTLKSGEFDGASHFLSPQVDAGSTSRIDWVPLSLKGTQRGDVYLEMTFFAAGPAPLNRRPSKFTNPAERLARPQQQPAAQRPQRLVSQPLPSGLTPGRQAQRPHSNEGSRQGRPKIQQVPLPGAWPGPSAQQRQSTQSSASSFPNRRSSRGEDTPLPSLPPDATPPKEEFVPSILRPGGPSRTGVGRAPSPPIANGTPGHHHTTPNDPGANTAYPPRHHTVNQTSLPFPGSPAPQTHLHSSSPQPQPTQPPSPHHASYSTQGTLEHVGGYSHGGHAATQPLPQAQPEVSDIQYHSQPYPSPQPHQQVQHSPWQQPQPQGGPPGLHDSPYPTNNHPAQPYVQAPGPPSPGQSYFAASSPKPPQPYVAPQIPSPPAPSHITAQSPPPVPHAWPYAPNTSPVPSARPHSTSPNPGASVPPTHQYVSTSGPVPPTQPYAPTPPPSAPPYTAPTNSVSLAQPYYPPTGSVLSPPPQSATPSPHVPQYISTPNPVFPLPTSPPPMPPHSPTYAPPPAPSFPVPSLPGPQSPSYFEPVTPAPFSPPTEPDLPDPYLFRRYQSPLPLPLGAPQPPRASPAPHPPRTRPDTRPEPTIQPLAAAAASSSTQRGRGVRQNEDERAAREFQRLEEESARARREQEERDEELARTLDLELNMGGTAGAGAQDEPGRTSHSQLPPLSTGVVRNTSVGEW
jgi:hypothetical protein